MLSVVLLVIQVLAVVFAPQSTKLYWISTMSSSASSTNYSLTSTSTSSKSSATTTASTITTGIPVLSNKLQRWKSSELTSFASSSATSKQKHESVAGSVIHGTFPCVWQNYNGYIVTGDRAIVFTGSFFLFEKTLILPWDDIRRVELVDNADVDFVKRSSSVNGFIDIVLNDDDTAVTTTTVHSFFNIRSPEKVWLLLLTLHNDALLGRKALHPSSSNSAPDTPRLQRHNSDPSLAGQSLGSSSTALFVPASNSDSALTSLAPDFSVPPCHDQAVVSTRTSLADSIAPTTIEAEITGQFQLQPIACTHSGVTGRLYTGPTAVYFTGKRYFWEHVSVTLPWSTIRHIVLAENDNDETNHGKTSSGISITTKNCALPTDGGSAAPASADPDETTFEFNDMDTPDKVWASLIALQNECLRSIPSSADALNEHSIPNGLQSPPPPLPPPIATPVMGTAERNRRKSLRRTNSDPRTVSLNLHYDTAHNDHASSPVVAVVAPSAVQTAAVLIPTVSPQSASQTKEESISDVDAWIAATKSDKVYDNVVIDRHVLPHNSSSGSGSLDQFFDLFFSDTAPYSLARFLQSRGDFDLHATTWQAAAAADATAAAGDESTSKSNATLTVERHTRVVQYMHPVNVPLAPPQARARKEQAVRRFGDAGLLIETETYVDDLPMTDCFYVADRIRIEPLSDAKDNKTTVVITMEFGITFVKSTMFRGIITRQTTSEFNALFKAMVQYMSDALINDIGATVKDDNAKGLPASSDINGQVDTDASALPTTLPFETVPVSDQSEPKQSFSWGHSISWTPDRIVLVIVLLLQLWLLFELRSIKQSLLYVSLRDDVSHNGQCSIGGV